MMKTCKTFPNSFGKFATRNAFACPTFFLIELSIPELDQKNPLKNILVAEISLSESAKRVGGMPILRWGRSMVEPPNQKGRVAKFRYLKANRYRFSNY